ncbi:uncharacterized protein [Prorops nasuta]|uniref:uncharacterized protein n=1 Tax=Prorops nasuta TaxID=863751 RepID=UPI0034CD8122
MLSYWLMCSLIWCLVNGEAPIQQGIKASNVLGSPEQHASFSFVRPGLTQTSFSFNGPSSHQSFSSSIGNPHLAQKVLPSLANALAYRNPGLGFFSSGPIHQAYATGSALAPSAFQTQLDQQYLYNQQLQQLQQPQFYQPQLAYQQQQQLAHLLPLRQNQIQQPQLHGSHTQQQIQQQSEEPQQYQQQQQQNLLGVAYSAAPSVAHVKVSGNGYKFDF